MIPRKRSTYSAIVDRPPLKLPGGARIVVWTIVNLEFWSISRAMARQVLPAPTGQVLLPDLPNWAWHEYGMRVGVWRFFELFGRLGIRPTLSINARVCEEYERVAGQAREAGWEFMGHAWEQMPIHKIDDQAAMIARSLDVLERFAGTRPKGWLGPGLTETWETPDLLVEEGYDYVCDWVLDDEPVLLKTRTRPIVNLPYTQECNDVAMMLIQHHKAGEYYDRAIDQFEQVHADSARSARVMALVVHPYIMGAAHRVKYLRNTLTRIRDHADVLFWTGEEILDWYRRVSP